MAHYCSPASPNGAANGVLVQSKTRKNASIAVAFGVKDVSNCYVDLVGNGHYALDLELFSGISQSLRTANEYCYEVVVVCVDEK